MDRQKKVKIGDLVRLKSGGPVMTVESFRDLAENECICIWFDDKKEVMFRNFNQTTLIRVKNKKE